MKGAIRGLQLAAALGLGMATAAAQPPPAPPTFTNVFPPAALAL